MWKNKKNAYRINNYCKVSNVNIRPSFFDIFDVTKGGCLSVLGQKTCFFVSFVLYLHLVYKKSALSGSACKGKESYVLSVLCSSQRGLLGFDCHQRRDFFVVAAAFGRPLLIRCFFVTHGGVSRSGGGDEEKRKGEYQFSPLPYLFPRDVPFYTAYDARARVGAEPQGAP